jgi:hypothetical protein
MASTSSWVGAGAGATMDPMRLRRCWFVVGCSVLVMVPVRASAQSTASSETLVSVRLHGEARGLRLRLYPKDPPADPEHDRLVATCARDCRIDLPPGSYRLKIEGPSDGDVQGGELNLEVAEDSDIAVKTGSAARRKLGLILGASGTTFAGVGLGGLVLGAMGALAHHDSSTCTTNECEEAWARSYIRWQTISAILFFVGVGPTAVGWIMFAFNKRPSVKVVSTRRKALALSAPQIGPIRVLGAWGLGGSVRF